MIKLLNPLRGAILKKWPDGDIRQLYGENPQWYSGKGHPGIDIAVGRGSEVLAAHDGIVQDIVPEFDGLGNLVSKYGNYLTILSPKNDTGEQILTQYAHLLDWTAQKDQSVKAGDVIGHEGNSGYVISGYSVFWGNAPAHSGNHLHFNVFLFLNGILQTGLHGMNTVDPMPLLQPMTVNQEELTQLYLAVFGRLPDTAALGYVGYDLLFILGEIMKSPEYQADAAVLSAVKINFNVKL